MRCPGTSSGAIAWSPRGRPPSGRLTAPSRRCPRPRTCAAAAAAAARSSIPTSGQPGSSGPPSTTVGSPRRVSAAASGCPSGSENTTNASTAASSTSPGSPSLPLAGTRCSATPRSAALRASPRRNSSAPGASNAYGSAPPSTPPSAPARPRRSERAIACGPAYPSCAAIASTRSRSSGESFSGRLYAFETVIADTPSASATVASVTRRGGPIGGMLGGARDRVAQRLHRGRHGRRRQPPVADDERRALRPAGQAVAGQAADADPALREPGDGGLLARPGRQAQQQVQARGDPLDAAVRQPLGEQRDEPVAARAVLAPGAAQVAVELAGGQQAGVRALRDGPAAGVDRPALARPRLGELGRREHPAEPQRRRERLGGGADVHDAVGREPLE